MKNLTVKQAEKWLEKIKQTDSAAFKDIGRCLKKFDQTSDEFECFVKMNQVLYTLPHIAQEINIYMEEGNKFLINKNLQERLNSFLDIARQTKLEIFREIVEYVNKIANEQQEKFNKSDKETHLIFTQGILNIVKEYPVLCAEAQKIIPVDQEDAFKQLDLKHLKNKTIIYEKDEDQLARNAMKKAKKVYDASFEQRPKQSFRPKFSPPIPSFLTISQEKSFLKQIQKKVGSNIFLEFMKLLEIYHHNIISKNQFISLVEPILGVDLYGFRDIIESRQFDRRKTSQFKPLSDIDFHILPRQTHSYVQMPANYPHYAINRTPELLSILNNKWVSVPRGSEVTFNVRIKNPYQLTLNKCEDERYQFDLIIGKLRKAGLILKQVLDQLGLDQHVNVNRKLNIVISMGILQILYKNASKQQKQVLQDSLTNHPQTTIKIFIERIQKVISDLQEHKKFYAIKNWNQASHKNFYKSLDFKNHEFKNYEKNKMKPQSFIDELNYNVKYLESRGTIKINQNPFQGKKQFFSLLNSFEASSRKQRCLNRQIINPPVYDLRNCKFPTLLPAMILGFQDHQVLTFSSTLTLCYIQSLPSSQAQKSRCRNAFKQVMSKLLKIKVFKYGTLNNHYEQQYFFTKILHGSSLEKIQNMLNYQFQNICSTEMIDQSQRKTPNLSSIRDIKSEYSFEPPKNQTNIIFYASQNFYVFLRYFYALYERILKMKQITTDKTKFKLFQILYFACIKYKQYNKFQEGLNLLFGQYAYLFSTFYKIVEGVCKAISVVALSPLENYSLGLMGLKNQDVYLLLLNRQMLNIQTTSPRLVRVAFQLDTCLMYIHSFNPFYRFNEQSLRQHNKKRLQMSKSVQTFNTEGQAKVDKKLVSSNAPCWMKNNQQYFFFSYSNKLINIPFYEDVLVGNKQVQNIAVEIEKVKKIRKKFV